MEASLSFLQHTQIIFKYCYKLILDNRRNFIRISVRMYNRLVNLNNNIC